MMLPDMFLQLVLLMGASMTVPTLNSLATRARRDAPGVTPTARSWNTVTKLLELADGEGC